MKPLRLALGLVLVLVLGACGGGSSSTDPDAPPGTLDAAETPPPPFRLDSAGRVALFEPAGAYVFLYSKRFEQPWPVQVASDGDCAVYHRPTPTCAGGCGAGVCVAPDTCSPAAALASAGDITITGLREPATFTPGQFGYTGPTLSGDFFADDAQIHVSAAGADLGAFSADVGGVAPLSIGFAALVELHDGEDETLAWTPAPGGARIQVALYLGWHGSPWTDLLVCETADDGDLTIPHGLIEQMPYFEVGLFQWPSSVMRFRRAWAGDVEILAASEIDLGMTHTQ